MADFRRRRRPSGRRWWIPRRKTSERGSRWRWGLPRERRSRPQLRPWANKWTQTRIPTGLPRIPAIGSSWKKKPKNVNESLREHVQWFDKILTPPSLPQPHPQRLKPEPCLPSAALVFHYGSAPFFRSGSAIGRKSGNDERLAAQNRVPNDLQRRRQRNGESNRNGDVVATRRDATDPRAGSYLRRRRDAVESAADGGEAEPRIVIADDRRRRGKARWKVGEKRKSGKTG